MKTYLYRHYDKNNILLYVGISVSHLARLCQHRDKAVWFDEIATVTIQPFPSRQEALFAETDAIIGENPLHNKRRPKVEHYEPLCSPEVLQAAINTL